jgi:hypothetical protein
MLVICNLQGSEVEDFDRQMRWHRNAFLNNSDWTQMPDSPLTAEQKEAWATYRQALRDFPATWVPAETAEFPEVPA